MRCGWSASAPRHSGTHPFRFVARLEPIVKFQMTRLDDDGDFAKLVEVFDRNGVTFVSVTQSFNTTTSMGRLTLNILLSFAQFEREVAGERIRDKIAATRRKGKWAGGMPVLGYDVVRTTGASKLVVNADGLLLEGSPRLSNVQMVGASLAIGFFQEHSLHRLGVTGSTGFGKVVIPSAPDANHPGAPSPPGIQKRARMASPGAVTRAAGPQDHRVRDLESRAQERAPRAHDRLRHGRRAPELHADDGRAAA